MPSAARARPPAAGRRRFVARWVGDLFGVAALIGLAWIFILPFLAHPGRLLWPAPGLGSDIAYIYWPLLAS